MDEHMLTTIDNPFHPFTQFDDWNAWDMRVGYNTLAYLARICRTSNDLTEVDESLAIELAIDEVLEHNLLGLYMRVSKDTIIKPLSATSPSP